MSCLTQVTLSALHFRHFSALAYGLTHKRGTRVVLDGHYPLTSKTCCLSLARRKTTNLQGQCHSRKQFSGCQETHGQNGQRRHHLSDSDGLYRLSGSARMSMAQQSSWFGVCIETSSIVTATSTRYLRAKISHCGELQVWKETRS